MNATAGTLRRIGFRALGCTVSIVVDERAGHAPLERLPAWFRSCEQVLSRFHARSELSQLNRRGACATVASPLLWHAMLAALTAAQWTDGLVHPAVLPALEHAGYDRDFAAIVSVDDESPASPGAPLADWHGITIDERAHTITLPAGVRVDFGGTAKGWIADHIANALSQHGPSLVDAGGDIAIAPATAAGSAASRWWPVGIASPTRPQAPLGRVHLQRGGIATSGRDHRHWRRGGRQLHHLIDPRTGEPADTDVLSATVVAANAFTAEVAAKVVMLRGLDDGLAWLDATPGLAGLVVGDDGDAVPSREFATMWER